ncbi:MAG: hypothetical protein H6809_02895 [Phycisphaeraceae bacterium]|nr:hypothetical protein [Phycisphaeraceae bacterium]
MGKPGLVAERSVRGVCGALAALVGVLAMAGVASAQTASGVLLEWRWNAGDERRYVVDSTVNQMFRDAEAEESDARRIRVTQTLDIVERVVGVEAGGVATVTHTYERVRVSGEDRGPDGTETFDYDSALRRGSPSPGAPATGPGTPAAPSPRTTRPDPRSQRPGNIIREPVPAPGGAPQTGQPGQPGSARPGGSRPGAQDDELHPWVLPFAALAGRTITYRITQDGRVLECTGADEGMEAMFRSLEGDGPLNPLTMLFAAAVNNDTLAAQHQSVLQLIPGRVVRPGERWELNLTQTLPLVGDLHTDITCRLASVRGYDERRTATIENRGEMRLGGGDAGAGALGGLFQVLLTSSRMDGTTEFDVQGGFIRSQSQRLVSEWETYTPDFENLDRMGEARKQVHRIEQDMRMRLER